MQLLALEVKNWCQHRDFTCQFGRGLIAITGRNGSGKSNIFGAIRWALTGENPNHGLKAENVAQLAGPGEKSFCKLELEHAGHIAVITRHILPEKEQATFVLDGEETARGDKNVTAAVETLLGLDSKFVSRFLLVQQDKLFRFIDDDKADVDKFFQRLFATDKANKCADVIGKHSAKIVVPEVAVPSSVISEQATAAHNALEQLSAQISTMPAMADVMTAQQEAQSLIQAWQAKEKATADLVSVTQNIDRTKVELSAITESVQKYEDDIAALNQAMTAAGEATAQARVALGHWAGYKKTAQLKADLQAAKERLAAERAATIAPTPPDVDEMHRLSGVVQERGMRIQQLRAFIDKFSGAGVANCPTCHTPTSQLAGYLEQCRADLPVLETELAVDSTRIAELAQQRKAVDAYAAKVMQWDVTEKAYAAQELQLADMQPPESTEDELNQIVLDYDSFQAAKRDMEPQLLQLRARKSQLEGTLAALQANQSKLAVDMASTTITEADVAAAQQKLVTLGTQAQQRQQLEQAYAQAQFEQTQRVNLYNDTVAKETQAAKLRDWLAVADKVREAFKAAPRLVAKRNLQRLETYVNDILKVFSADFYVTASDDSGPNFLANFADGRQQVAQRLSFGQKTVLAVAFRVAVVSLFSSDVGFLALDEPTVYMDQPAVQSFSVVLEKLREISAANGLQCLIITHETALSHAFESLIEVSSQANRV
jgi:DNA repair exonuclease SbcCD ATPase subunit